MASFAQWNGAGIIVVFALAPLLGYAIAHAPASSFPLPLLALGLVLIPVAALQYPRIAVTVGVLVMALPYTWSPHVPKIGGAFGVLVGLALGASAVIALRRFQLTALDWFVLAYAFTAAPISVLNGGGFHLVTLLAPATTFPYFGFRWFFHVTGVRPTFATAAIWAGILTSILGVIETVGGKNPILPAQTMNAPGTPQVWDVPLHRNGLLRAESTFGHPIAFGMFLLIPLAFAASRPGARYLIATGIILAGELVTLSRGPWLGAAAVMLILSRWNRKRIALAIASAAVAVLAVPPLHSLILQTGGTTSESGQTAHYRIGLITGAFHQLTFLGHGSVDITRLVPGFADVTSWLAVTILSFGVIGLVELVVLCLLVARLTLVARRDGSRDYLAAAAAVVGQLVGLLTVTLITSYEFFFWASLAYLAATAQESRQRAWATGAA